MSEPWPPAIMRSFSTAKKPDVTLTPEFTAFTAPYNRLLWHLFGVLGPYDVVPPWRDPHGWRTDSVVYQSPFTVVDTTHADRRPVFFVDAQPAAHLAVHSYRAQADTRMRGYLRAFVGDFYMRMEAPCLYGASAFGSRVCFYKYADGFEPRRILPDPSVLNDLAPTARWDCDLMEPEGAARFRAVVESVLQMNCQQE